VGRRGAVACLERAEDLVCQSCKLLGGHVAGSAAVGTGLAGVVQTSGTVVARMHGSKGGDGHLKRYVSVAGFQVNRVPSLWVPGGRRNAKTGDRVRWGLNNARLTPPSDIPGRALLWTTSDSDR
jgi:hypothetical protein